MARVSTHAAVGAVVGVTTYLICCRLFQRQTTAGELLLSAVGGVTFAIAPDLLEPALDPGHRAFFHSITLLGGMTFGGYKALTSPGFTEQGKLTLLTASTAYASHLILDLLTPKSLPFI